MDELDESLEVGSLSEVTSLGLIEHEPRRLVAPALRDVEPAVIVGRRPAANGADVSGDSKPR